MPRRVAAFSLAIILVLVLSLPAPVQAESYFAGELGLTVPLNLRHIKFIGIAPGSNTDSIDLQTSVLYGGKAGYFFQSLPWLGIEAEAFNTHPNISDQARILNVPGNEPTPIRLQGENLRVFTIAANLVVRLKLGRFEPYAGVGPARFYARRSANGDSHT